jgi:hypothetical protein
MGFRTPSLAPWKRLKHQAHSPSAVAMISAVDVTDDIGSGVGMEPPADGEQSMLGTQGKADKVSKPVGMSSCPIEASTLSEVER